MPHDADFYDRDGAPITWSQYGELRRDEDYRRLRTDEAAGLMITTVWLGMDQGPLGEETRPLIFGTAIVDPTTRDLWDGYETFAATEDEARANHAAAVDRAATRPIAAGCVASGTR